LRSRTMQQSGIRQSGSIHGKVVCLCAFLLLIPVAASSQTGGTSGAPSIEEIPRKPVNEIRRDKDKKDEENEKKQNTETQTKRMLWVVPNFAAVSANTQLPPLTPRGKFVLAFHDSFDYSSFAWTGIISAQSYALNSDPELGSGFKGYARYYWRAFVDGVSGTYFTEAIVPVISREDPRYYTLGHGGFFRRMAYALSRTVLTKTDSGGISFNWSEVGGNACQAALSNFYYPPQERGSTQTLRDWGNGMESAALNNIAKEFWPDVRHKVLRQK
jgi:hypothetical protein